MGGTEEDGDRPAMVLELPLSDPSFDLEKAVCSHGLFMTAPNRWDSSTKSLLRPLRLASEPSASLPVRISHSHSDPIMLLVSVSGTASLSSEDQHFLLAQVRRMLRMSDENDRVIREFHEVHAGSKERGFGRVFRSPTLFEDMVKCILLCNCQWSRTLSMASALCELQTKLKGSCTVEDFQPKTPQPREKKRKRIKEKKAMVKLEAEFKENDSESLVDANSVVSSDTQTPFSVNAYVSDSSCLPRHPVLLDNKARDSCSVDQLNGDTCKPFSQTGNFPSAEELASLDVDFLSKCCKLGYRAERIVSLAKSIVDHKLQLAKLEEACEDLTPSSYDELVEQLSGISGFGPFTRANILMCMGFYHNIPTDTETVRHLKQFHRVSSCSKKSVQLLVEKIYGKYKPFQFLAYWSEIWDGYENRFGKLSDMPPGDYQRITASNMKSKNSKKRR